MRMILPGSTLEYMLLFQIENMPGARIWPCIDLLSTEYHELLMAVSAAGLGQLSLQESGVLSGLWEFPKRLSYVVRNLSGK